MLQALFTLFLIKYNNKGMSIIIGIAVIYFGVRIIAYITYRLIDMFRFNHLRALMEFEQQFHGTLFQEASCILNITMILLTVLLWITAYYCLREKELE